MCTRPSELLLLFWLSTAVSGCGSALFVEPRAHPVLEDQVGRAYFTGGSKPLATLATSAERRIVLVNINREPKDKNSKYGHICSEPSPDAGENIAFQLAWALATAASYKDAAVEVRSQFSKQLATAVQSLFHRSQGLQLYRDSMYNLCVMFWNEIITPDQYATRADTILTSAVELIGRELDLTGGVVGGPSPGPLPSLSPSEITEVDPTNATTDKLRANKLFVSFQEAQKKKNSTNMKIALTGLYEILVTHNQQAKSEKDRTLSETDQRHILDRLRPLAKNEQSQLKLVTLDGLKDMKDATPFIELFL